MQDLNIIETFPQDAIQNENYSKTKITMPVRAIAAGYDPAFGGNITSNSPLHAMKAFAQNARGIFVPNSGHWIPEERPDFLIKELGNFFGDNSTKTGE